MASTNKNIMVLGFPIDTYSKTYLDKLTPHQLYEHALEIDDNIIYDDIDTFFGDLNNGFIDTENIFWYNVLINEFEIK